MTDIDNKETEMSNEKKPRLFYWEDAEDAWVPCGDEYQELVSLDMLEDGETTKIMFKRMDMTDAEFDAIPEC